MENSKELKHTLFGRFVMCMYLCALLAMPHCLHADNAVGTPKCDFTVNRNGAAVYNIGIDAPTGGLQPYIAISYNSQAGQGLVGYGFNISGITYISRGCKDLFHDGTQQGVKHVADDALYFNGTRLIPNTESAGWDGDTYSPEGNPYTTVTIHGAAMSPSCWFDVKTPDGKKYEYGRSDDSRLSYKNSSGVLRTTAWYICRVEDSNADYTTYEYMQDAMTVYPLRICYGMNAVKSRGITNRIEMQYSDLGNNSVIFTKGGIRGRIAKCLSAVQTSTDGHLFRKYNFEYNGSSDKSHCKYTRLIRVAVASGDGSELVPISIEWNSIGTPLVSSRVLDLPTMSTTELVEDQDRMFVATDINNDGVADILRLSPVKTKFTSGTYDTYLYVSLSKTDSNGSVSYTTPVSYSLGPNFDYSTKCIIGGVQPMDFDGDGYNDIAIPRYVQQNGEKEQQFIIFYGCDLAGVRKKPCSTLHSPIVTTEENTIYETLDVNGDGKDEIISIEKDGLNGVYQGAVMQCAGNAALDYTVLKLELAGKPQKMFTADYNGDGLYDLILFYDGGYKIYYNTGGKADTDRFIEGRAKVVGGFGDCRRITQGDFNGDGLLDFLYYISGTKFNLALNNGDGTFEHMENVLPIDDIDNQSTNKDNDRFNVLVCDVDHDGKSDIVIVKAVYRHRGFPHFDNEYKETRIKWLYYNGSTFDIGHSLTTTREEDANPNSLFLGDFTGEGKTMLANMGSDLYTGSHEDTNQIRVYDIVGADISQGRVSVIYDSYKRATVIKYKSATSPSVYDRGDYCEWPVVSRTVPIPVVAQTVEYNGVVRAVTKDYRYTAAKMHTAGRGMLGFSGVKVTDTSMQTTMSYNVTEWDREHWVPISETTSTTISDGSMCTETSHSSIERKGNNYFTYVSSTEFTDYDGLKTETQYAYDTEIGAPTDKTIFYDGGREMFVQYTYDDYQLCANGWQPRIVDIMQKHRDNKYCFSSTTRYSYDSKGNAISVIKRADTSNPLTSHYTYDTYGNVLTSYEDGTGVSMNIIANEYDTSGRFLTAISETASSESHRFTYDIWGNMLSESDLTDTLNVATVTHEYDAWGNETRTTDIYGNVTTTETGWGDSEYRKYYVLTVSENKPWVKTWYDNAEREVYSESVGLKGVSLTSSVEYNDMGLACLEVRTIGKLRVANTWKYDHRGRIVNESTSTGKSMSYTYTGRTKSIKSAGKTHTITYDAWGNVVRATSPSGTVEYQYAPNGKPSTVSASGNTINIKYDDAGFRTSIQDSDAGTTLYTYAADGKLLNKTDARGVTTVNMYDSKNRLTKSTVGALDRYYTYDAKNRLVKSSMGGANSRYYYNRYGQITKEVRTPSLPSANTGKAQNGTDTSIAINDKDDSDNSSDDDNELSSYTITTDNNKTVSYTYTKGVQTRVTYPNNHVVDYGYDRYGNLETTKFLGAGIYRVDSYDGRELVASFCDSIHIIQIFDEMGYESERFLIAGSDTIASFRPTYDPTTGNLTARRIDNDDVQTFSYDLSDRLISAVYDNNTRDTVKYGHNNNILFKTGIGEYAYEGQRPHAITSVSNEHGVVPLSTQSCSYNDMNLPEEVSDGDSGARLEIGYGPDGEKWITFYRDSDNTVERKTYINGFELDQWKARCQSLFLNDGLIIVNHKPYLAFTDNLGSILCVIDASGKRVFEASYDAWGKQTVTKNDIHLRHGYCGHEAYAALGIINMGARLYDPALGLFFSPDNYVQLPENSLNYNRYSYCLNNPLKYVDPDGNYFGLDDVLSMLVGGTLNLGVNLVEGNIHGIGHAITSFAVGAVAGEASLYVSPVAGAAILGSANSVVNQGFANGFNHIDFGQVGMDTGMAMLTSTLGGFLGNAFSPQLNRLTSKISNSIVQEMLKGSLSDGISGFCIGSAFAYANNKDKSLGSILGTGLKQAGIGLVTGAISGISKGISQQYHQKHETVMNLLSCKDIDPNQVVTEALNNPQMPSGKGTYSVYMGRDKLGVIRYIGITKRPVGERFNDHYYSNTKRSDLEFNKLNNTGHLSKIQARIIEQTLINTYRMESNGGLLYNKINSISPLKWYEYGIK